MAAEPPTKFRRPNYNEAEMLAVVEEVKKRKAVILGKLEYKAGVTSERKTRAWDEVAAAVNAVARVRRTPEELRRKFKDMRTQVKSKSAALVRHMEGTGGGPPKEEKFSQVEEAMLDLLSPTGYAGLPVPDSEDGSLNVAGAMQCLPSQALGPVQKGPHPSTSGTPQEEFVMVVEGEEQRIPIISESSLESSAQSPATAEDRPRSVPSSRPPSQGGRRSRTPTGLMEEIKVAPQLLHVNEEIRDLISNLERTQREAVALQRENVAMQRETVAALQKLAETPEAILKVVQAMRGQSK